MPQPTPNSESDRHLAGQELGDYFLLRRLGRGGMAEVYLAEQRSLKRNVAVKVLRRDLANQPDYVRRFHHEAQAAAKLVHANIVQIYEVGCIDGNHFIAQEYVQGQNVSQLVDRTGPLEIARVLSILRQIAAALNKASQHHIVHRDIKPENIMLMSSGEVKVADFGLARAIDQENLNLTQVGLTMGTPLYMSPEQVEGKPLDFRSDLYSCGVTAFYMLVGRPPFEGDTPLSVAVQHLQNPPPNVQDLRDDIPDSLAVVVTKLLAKKPSDRYHSAADLLRELRAIQVEGADYHLPLDLDALPESDVVSLHGTGGLAVTQQLQSLMETQALLKVPRRRPWLIVAGCVAAALIGGALAAVTWSGPLLSNTPDGTETIEAKPSANAQYVYAAFRNTEEAYLAVALHHPPEKSPENRYWSRRALHQLGLLYLERGDLDRAYEAFDRLAKVEQQETHFRAIGLAGLALVHDQRNQLNELSERLAEVWELRDELDPVMRQEVEQIVVRRKIPIDPS